MASYAKDIKNVFGGRSLGAVSVAPTGTAEDRPDTEFYKQGHISTNYVKGLTMKEEAFLQKLKNEIRKEIL